jgi:tetratricopeptide (TPR) repeat protein
MNEQTEYAYDVFVSYSHDDEEWVTDTLLPRLGEAGLRVCIDYRDFVAGKPALVNMQDAAKNSRHTVLVLTPAWVESEWTLYESLLTRTSDPAGLQRRTVPLLLQLCENLPDFIAMLTWVDFTRPDRLDIAWTQLLTALGAPPVQEAPEEPTRAEWCLKHPYPMPPNFTGRAAEREMLSRWLGTDTAHPLLVLRALGGFGKSALNWHWLLHDVDPARWPRVVWWSFYEGDANFDSFLRETLAYLSGASGATHFQSASHLGPCQQADELLRLLHQPGILLILDGFERALRAYSGMDAAYRGDDPAERETQSHASRITQQDCVSPIAEHFLRNLCCLPGMRGKVLMTTRLRPRALETHGGDLLQGCQEEELTQMQPADAVAFFRAQGVRGSRAEIERACQSYGYHPLSLRLLAGLVARDLQQPGDIAAARRLDVTGDLVQRQHHVLAQAYDNLTPARQELLSRIACFRGAVAYEALRAVQTSEVSETSEVFATFDADLRDLVARGLLHHDRQIHRYDLHPIVRRYAYDRLGGVEREAAHGQLRDYFAAVPPPEQVRTLEDLAPVIELYHHTVWAGQYDEALDLFYDRLVNPLHFQFGVYQLNIELLRVLFPDGDPSTSSGQAALPRLKDESAQAWTLNTLAASYSLSGQLRRAVPLFERQIAIREKQGDKPNLVSGLENLATQQMIVGGLQAAEASLRRAIALCREIEDEFNEATGHQELGRLLAYRGAWDEAEEELEAALRFEVWRRNTQGVGVNWAYRALRVLLLARWTAITPHPQSPSSSTPDALAAARRALELADETARTRHPHERDYVRAHWLLGTAHRANGDFAEADRRLSGALTRCRSINMVDYEADILLDLARLRAGTRSFDSAQDDWKEALRLAQEALVITERSGYVLQGADVHLFLAQIALQDRDKGTALAHAQEARRLAACDGPPDYTYKVAYDEAGALLQRIESG